MLKNIYKFIAQWWPTLLTLSVVLYATLWPDPAGASAVMLFPGADKIIHAVMMGGLSAAVLFDRRRAGQRLTQRYIVAVALCMLIFSLADEWAQTAMGIGRTGDVWDLLADAGGIVIAATTAPPVINRIFRKRQIKTP